MPERICENGLGTLALLSLLLLSTLLGCSSGNDYSDEAGTAKPVANPIITPVAAVDGRMYGGMRYNVTQSGYQVREFFFAGEAVTFPSSDAPPAPYRSRMLVWTPTDPSRFNGTTVVEWAHVSDFGQFELTVELNYLSPLLVQRGYAFVLVSAEEGGVCDLGPIGCTSTSLRGANPQRYESLHHPGDRYSFDIFNQAMQAIKYPSGTAPLGNLRTQFIVAQGFQPSIDKWFPVGAPDTTASTSPFGLNGPLNAYLTNGADAAAHLVDAFLIDAAAPGIEPDNYRVPTLHHLDESAYRRTPTQDRPNHVTWEVIGAAHVDRWSGSHIYIPRLGEPAVLLRPQDEDTRRDAADNFGQVPDSSGEVCAPGPYTGSLFPRRFTLNAALVALDHWLETGVPAPAAPRAERVGPPPDTAAKKLLRDADGNAIGGLRTPLIQVPVASYNGEACIQAGTTTILSGERLAALYPTHRSYVEQLLAAVDEAVENRFLLCPDAQTILRKASDSVIGGNDKYSALPACAQVSGGG